LIFIGCAAQDSVYVKDEKEYGITSGLFNDQWWNFYERGLSFAEGEFYEEAIKDFQTAIQMRRDDQWQSRTYGMHFINFFPHRELGIIYYKTKKYNDSKRELEQSLRTAESAKAKYFLNMTRKAILEESSIDKLPPFITIYEPLDESIINGFTVNLSGEAKDDFFVSSLKLNAIPSYIELSSKKIPFEKELALNKGFNEIRIHANDLTGKTADRTVIIYVDVEGPMIVIEEQITQRRKVLLSGILTDNTGIASFNINGKKIFEDLKGSEIMKINKVSGQEIKFNHEINIQKDTDTIILLVEDSAGNVTKGELNVGLQFSSMDSTSLFASSLQYVLLDNMADKVPPEIHLKDLMDFHTVYSDSLYIEGSVFDRSSIKDILINGKSVLKRNGKKVFFNNLIKLKEGANSFFVEAIDFFGNKSEKKITVNRKIPKIRQLGSRMSISVLPFEKKGERSISGNAVYESFVSALVNQKRFRIIEREKLEEVLSELKLSKTGIADPDTASKIGKIVVAEAIMTGIIYERKNSLEVLTRLIDTDTGNIIVAKDVFDEDKGFFTVNKLGQGLALKYKESLPLLEGIVAEKDGKELIIDLGKDTKIKKNMGLIIFREGHEIIHPSSGRPLGRKIEKLGEAKVDNVYEKYSSAIVEKGKEAEIRTRDKLITK
jgi:tetratricopeptide (TPR) repeat protein